MTHRSEESQRAIENKVHGAAYATSRSEDRYASHKEQRLQHQAPEILAAANAIIGLRFKKTPISD